MNLRVLGCSGGIGGQARTTSFLLGDTILIDAGTGVMDLEQAAMTKIDHIFLTHSHMDHICSLPPLLDSVGPARASPLVVHAQAATLDILREHIFNWKIWPDFTEIPDKTRPFLQFRSLEPGEIRHLGGVSILSVPVEHTVPAVGFVVRGPEKTLAFSGDMDGGEEFWQVVNREARLDYLIIEATFPDRDEALSRLSKHLCPATLSRSLVALSQRPEVYITHMMPDQVETILAEIARHTSDWSFRQLAIGNEFIL